jgi:hypothetical protein
MRQNDTTCAPNLAEVSNNFSLQNSEDFIKAEQTAYLMEALREEHVRVHLQDQNLLKSLNGTCFNKVSL